MAYINKTLSITAKNSWATPPEVVQACERFFDITFTLDACASEDNKKVNKFITEQQNTLKTDWGKGETVWMNPPYSAPLPFIKRAIEMSKNNDVVLLLNADSSTEWFEHAVQRATKVIFLLRKRIAFLNPETGKRVHGNNKPQVIFYFGPQNRDTETYYIKYSEFIDENHNYE